MLSSFVLSMFVSVGKIITFLATGVSALFHQILDATRECFLPQTNPRLVIDLSRLLEGFHLGDSHLDS